MARVPNDVETLPKISIAWVERTNVADDRQTTDGPAMTYSERELTFTFAKNGHTQPIVKVVSVTHNAVVHVHEVV